MTVEEARELAAAFRKRFPELCGRPCYFRLMWERSAADWYYESETGKEPKFLVQTKPGQELKKLLEAGGIVIGYARDGSKLAQPVMPHTTGLRPTNEETSFSIEECLRTIIFELDYRLSQEEWDLMAISLLTLLAAECAAELTRNKLKIQVSASRPKAQAR